MISLTSRFENLPHMTSWQRCSSIQHRSRWTRPRVGQIFKTACKRLITLSPGGIMSPLTKWCEPSLLSVMFLFSWTADWYHFDCCSGKESSYLLPVVNGVAVYRVLKEPGKGRVEAPFLSSWTIIGPALIMAATPGSFYSTFLSTNLISLVNGFSC